MNKKLQMILLALGLSVAIAFTGCSSDDDEDTVTAPSAPDNVAAILISPTVVTVSWTAALDDAPTSYIIGRRTAESDWIELANVATSVTSYNDSTVAGGYLYSYRVGASNSGGVTYATTTPNIATYNQSLLGLWNATDAIGQIGTDSSTFTFRWNEATSAFEYRRLDYYESLDDTDWDAGTFDAVATSIVFTVQAVNGSFVDSTYTWNYDLNSNGEDLTIEYNYGEGAFDVDFELVPEPPVE